MNKTPSNKFIVTVPVKPYVKRFLEINFGLPVEFTNHPKHNDKFLSLLRKPCYKEDKKIPDTFFLYSETVDIFISEHDFYKHGWELTKTNIVAFGSRYEDYSKLMMRSIVGTMISIGLPVNKSILRFQKQFQFTEDIWSYETIKKDYYRRGHNNILDFDNEIYNKITYLIMRNLSDFGTITPQAILHHETLK